MTRRLHVTSCLNTNTTCMADLLAVPHQRRSGLERLASGLRELSSIALSTHVNADGDGCGSQAAMARLLGQMGIRAHIVNPTPWPAMFEFLLGDDVKDSSARGGAALRKAGGLMVLDISDVRRLGTLADAVRELDVPTFTIDHHVPGDEPPRGIIVSDTSACATGELVFDFAMVLKLEMTPEIARSLYTALLTDTGGFRFSNTSPRCHAIAGQLLRYGVDPEEMYQRIYASVSLGRMRLLRDALDTLDVDASVGLSWIALRAGAAERYGVTSEELDGIAEHARSIAGTRMALFFRELPHGQVKLSLRSTGDTDVQRFSRAFGGGGHAKASGALIKGGLDSVRERVLGAAREYLRTGALPAEAAERSA